MSSKELKANRAREILDYCRHGLTELQKDPTGYEWILRWVGTLALLRTVDEVLKNVDAQSNPLLAKARSNWKNELKRSQPAIYWEFIRGDANKLLHQAEIRAGQSASVSIAGVAADARAAGEEKPPLPKTNSPKPSSSVSYQMNSGTFAGRDPRDVVREAIEWWQNQVATIEQDAAKLSS
jgi:hypothetical protein